MTSTPPIGLDALRAALPTIPTNPGIYKMLDGAGKPLYIGKAKHLRNRVTSYTNINNLSTRIMRMVAQVSSVEIITTRNEAEALLMEASLVRRFMPRYNVLLKDDKSFPYLRIDTSHPFPRIEKHRGSQNKPGEYYGPFASVGALNETMATLQKIFQLRPCEDTIFKNRARPCLQYQIKRCTAPCVGYVDEGTYREQINRARDFLKGRHRDVQEALARDMQVASDAMEYEKAAALRDRIHALTQVQQEQGLRASGLDDADVIALARRGNKSVVQVFFFRNGGHFGNQSFHPRHESDESDADILENFLAQFYQTHLPPPEILLGFGIQDSGFRKEKDHSETAISFPESRMPNAEYSPREQSWEFMPLLSEALSLHAGYKVELRVPQRGDKLDLVTNAKANAEAALARLEMERATVHAHLTKLKELFGLRAQPARIEVYDNSHIMGTNAIGAFIVATQEGFDKRSYRTFNIKDAATKPGDDYAMMREVFRRRFKGIVTGHKPSPPAGEGWMGGPQHHTPILNAPLPNPPREGEGTTEHSSMPDLVLIDGGLGQLNAVVEALDELGVKGPALVAISKGEDRNAGREWFHQPGKSPFQLPVNDPLLHYLQRLRDEAHRFAIGRHRNKRSAGLTTSALDDIPGIGSARKRALLQHFGSRSAVETATLSELEKVTGISKTTARSIYDYFHG